VRGCCAAFWRGVDAVNLKPVLGKIETDRANMHSGWPLNCGVHASFNLRRVVLLDDLLEPDAGKLQGVNAAI
jgi:hypothetical protein